MKSKNRYESRYGIKDALTPLRFCLKILQAWPANQTRLQRYISYLNFPVITIVQLPLMIWYILVDGPNDGKIAMFRAVCDIFAILTFISRGVLVLNCAKDVYKLSELSTKGCKPYEEGHEVVLIMPSRVVWCPTITVFVQLCLSFVATVLTLWVKFYQAEVDQRNQTVPLSKTVLRTDFVFYPLVIFISINHISVWFAISTSDAFIISLSTTVREKAETMKNLLRDFVKIHVHSQQIAELGKIIKYHNIISYIRNETERIMGNTMLLQFSFLFLSLGTPAMRLIKVGGSMSTGELGFTVSYMLWAISQLIVYCEVCEAATHSCSSLAFAAYSAYHPDMSVTAARNLVLMIARAQRPMDFTARKLIKINRKTLLKISRKSYSLFSAVLKLK